MSNKVSPEPPPDREQSFGVTAEHGCRVRQNGREWLLNILDAGTGLDSSLHSNRALGYLLLRLGVEEAVVRYEMKVVNLDRKTAVLLNEPPDGLAQVFIVELPASLACPPSLDLEAVKVPRWLLGQEIVVVLTPERCVVFLTRSYRR